jgi:hypothetical protein
VVKLVNKIGEGKWGLCRNLPGRLKELEPYVHTSSAAWGQAPRTNLFFLPPGLIEGLPKARALESMLANGRFGIRPLAGTMMPHGFGACGNMRKLHQVRKP